MIISGDVNAGVLVTILLALLATYQKIIAFIAASTEWRKSVDDRLTKLEK